MIEIRNTQGEVFNRVNRPTVVFDSETFTWHKIGELEDMIEYLHESRDAYSKAGLRAMAKSLKLLELPQDQELVDNVFNITGYIRVVFEKSQN